jgi:hypothetical protein
MVTGFEGPRNHREAIQPPCFCSGGRKFRCANSWKVNAMMSSSVTMGAGSLRRSRRSSHGNSLPREEELCGIWRRTQCRA